MAVSSVNSASSTANLAVPPAKTRTENDAQKADAARAAADADQARREQASRQAPAPKPVVNSEGQTTGRIINEKA